MVGAQRRGIVTGGTWCVDLNKLIAAWPRQDTATEILEFDRRGGGSGYNLAVDMRRLDPEMPVETIGLVGDDDNGRYLAAECDACGIDRSQLHVAAGQTFCVDAFAARDTGLRTHFFYPGTGAALTPDHFDFSRTRARILHLGLPGVQEKMDAPWQGHANGWEATFRKAKAAGLLTNFELVTIDRDKLAGLARPCLPLLDLLVVNDFEIGALSGVDTLKDGQTDVAAVLGAARAVLEAGAMQVVAVHFPRGAIAVTRDGSSAARGSVRVPPDAIAGVNGAGDAFAAGFLYGFHEGWDLDRALALAHATAAASMRAISTVAAVEDYRTCLALADRWGWREGPV